MIRFHLIYKPKSGFLMFCEIDRVDFIRGISSSVNERHQRRESIS